MTRLSEQRLDTIIEQDRTISAIRSELAAYRALPLVPKADHDRVCQQRDDALRQLDALAAQFASAQDARTAVVAKRATDLLSAVMQTLARSAGGPGEVSVWREANAFLAEQGLGGPDEGHVQAYAEWSRGRS